MINKYDDMIFLYPAERARMLEGEQEGETVKVKDRERSGEKLLLTCCVYALHVCDIFYIDIETVVKCCYVFHMTVYGSFSG